MSIQFSSTNAIGKNLLVWWEGLENERASRAMLRRASSITAVVLTPPYQRLYRRLRELGWDDRPHLNDRLAAVVGLLAHVRQNDDRPLAKSMSGPRDEGGDQTRVSELRFLRFLDSPDLDALFTSLRRLLPLMNHKANVLVLANDIVHWGDAVKKRWAYDYEWPEKAKG